MYTKFVMNIMTYHTLNRHNEDVNQFTLVDKLHNNLLRKHLLSSENDNKSHVLSSHIYKNKNDMSLHARQLD